MSLKDYLTTCLIALVLSVVFVYTMLSAQLGFDPRLWNKKIKAEQLYAERIEYDRVCLNPRP